MNSQDVFDQVRAPGFPYESLSPPKDLVRGTAEVLGGCVSLKRDWGFIDVYVAQNVEGGEAFIRFYVWHPDLSFYKDSDVFGVAYVYYLSDDFCAVERSGFCLDRYVAQQVRRLVERGMVWEALEILGVAATYD